MIRRRRLWLLPPLLGGLTGCGPGNGLDLAPVRGTITYRGEPLRFGYVTFVPAAARGTKGPPATAVIAEDGTFVLSTEHADDGAIVGTHKVRIPGLDPDPVSDPGMPAPSDDPEGFLTAKAQMGRRTARQEEPTHMGRDGKHYRIVVPERFLDPETSGIAVEVEGGWNSHDFDIMIAEDGPARVE